MLGRITVALFFLLLVWGNLVAGMKAGMACPDWPLCQGQLLPPFRLDIWMEFMHRVIAATATVFLLVLGYVRFRSYHGAAKAIPLAAVGLVAAEIVIGGLAVLLELPLQLTTIHFVTGLLVFVSALYMAAFDGEKEPAGFTLKGYALLFFGLGALIFSQAALGAYVRHAQAGLACPDFPTCLGHWLPPLLTGPMLIHFSHRLLAYFILVTTAILYIAALMDERLRRQRKPALFLVIIGILQIGVGAGVVQSGLNFAATALHLAVALVMLSTLGWMWAREVRGDVSSTL